MEITKIKTKLLECNCGQISNLPANPRKWETFEVQALAKSIKETPELLEARPLLVLRHESKFVVIGGNMRLAACKLLAMDEAPCIILSVNADTAAAVAMKDNANYGHWDTLQLEEWSEWPLDEWVPDLHFDEKKEKKEIKEEEKQEQAPAVQPSVVYEYQPPAPPTDTAVEAQKKESGNTEMSRIIIIFPADQAARLADALGLKKLNKLIYNLDELGV